MALNFVITKNLTTEVDQNVDPLYVNTPYLIQEPDNKIFQYYTLPQKHTAWDKQSEIPLGQYDVLPWGAPSKHLTTRAVSKIGVKHFPQIGAIGFYKDLYTSLSTILAPIHEKHVAYEAPTLEAVLSGRSVSIKITPPDSSKYSCYRVVFRSGYFAVESVVYNLEEELDAPLVNGDYEVYAIGYNEVTGTYSTWSNVEHISIADGADTWEPESLKVPMKLSDLSDVNIVDLLNAQMLRFNAETQKWENASATAMGATRIVEVTLLASAWLAATELNTYTQIVTIEGTTEFSKVDLQPSAEQLVIFHERDVNFTTVNEDGTIVVYAVGDKPINDYTIQATVTEVTIND